MYVVETVMDFNDAYCCFLLHAIVAAIKVAGAVVLSSNSSEIEEAPPRLITLAVVAATEVASPKDHYLRVVQFKILTNIRRIILKSLIKTGQSALNLHHMWKRCV